jgi:hypothetical protein
MIVEQIDEIREISESMTDEENALFTPAELKKFQEMRGHLSGIISAADLLDQGLAFLIQVQKAARAMTN